MSQDPESPLSLVAQVEAEIEAMLEGATRQAGEMRRRAQREAARLVRDERATLQAAEEAVVKEVMTAGRTRLECVAAECAADVTELRSTVEARMREAVQTIVVMVTGDHHQ